MAITLSDGTTTIDLPADLLWRDRDSWSPVEQSVTTSITGNAIIDVGARVNGRPITLEGDDQHAWISYATLSSIKSFADSPGKQMVLTINGSAFDVVFRHQDAPAVDMSPVVDYAAPDAQDFFYGSLKFTEV